MGDCSDGLFGFKIYRLAASAELGLGMMRIVGWVLRRAICCSFETYAIVDSGWEKVGGEKGDRRAA